MMKKGRITHQSLFQAMWMSVCIIFLERSWYWPLHDHRSTLGYGNDWCCLDLNDISRHAPHKEQYLADCWTCWPSTEEELKQMGFIAFSPRTFSFFVAHRLIHVANEINRSTVMHHYNRHDMMRYKLIQLLECRWKWCRQNMHIAMPSYTMYLISMLFLTHVLNPECEWLLSLIFFKIKVSFT